MVIEKRQYKDFTYYVLRKRGATPFYIRRVSHLNPLDFMDDYPLNYIERISFEEGILEYRPETCCDRKSYYYYTKNEYPTLSEIFKYKEDFISFEIYDDFRWMKVIIDREEYTLGFYLKLMVSGDYKKIYCGECSSYNYDSNEVRFHDVEFADGPVLLLTNNNFFLFQDINGNLAHARWCEFSGGFDHDLAKVKENKWGIVDRDGAYVLSPEYDEISDFYEHGNDYVKVRKGDSIRYYNLEKKKFGSGLIKIHHESYIIHSRHKEILIENVLENDDLYPPF